MKEWLMGQGIILYVFAGCLVIGLVASFIANHGYKRLIKETEVMGNTENRLLKYIKLKFGSYYKLNMKPQDTRALAKHYMYKYKIGFMNAASWVKLSKLAAGVIALAGLVDMLLMFQQGKTYADVIMTAILAVIGLTVLYIQNRLCDFSEKREMLEWHLMDYLENFLRNKIESGKNLQKLAVDGNLDAITNDYAANQRTGYAANNEKKPQPARHQEASRAAHVSGGMEAKGTDEAAATKIASPYSKAAYYDPFVKQTQTAGEDEIDAKIVEDILKEFLN